MSEPICPKCRRPFPDGWTAGARARKSEALKEALARVRAQGVHIGRKRAIPYKQVYRLYDEGVNLCRIARAMGCSRGSIQHALRVRKSEENKKGSTDETTFPHPSDSPRQLVE